MKILAINTTNSFAEVCFKDENKIITNTIKSPYSENIMHTIEKTLSDAGKELSEIDALGIVTGPGSFTGIRIGMAVIKGIMCGLNIPVVAINSFDLISYNIYSKSAVMLLDSGNNDSYYSIAKNGEIKEIGFATIENIKTFANNSQLKIYYASMESEKFGHDNELLAVDVKQNTLANIISDKALNNEFTEIEKLSPIYIKLSQAEIGLEQKMKENLSFAVANLNDANALAVVDSQCFDGKEGYSAKSFEEELKEPSKHYIVAKYQDLIIGYIGLQILGDELNLLKIAVLPQYRKLGVGFKLMELSFKYKKDNNLSNYFLEVRESNEPAKKLYSKFGFKVQSKREKYYSDGETALVMFCK